MTSTKQKQPKYVLKLSNKKTGEIGYLRGSYPENLREDINDARVFANAGAYKNWIKAIRYNSLKDFNIEPIPVKIQLVEVKE